MLPQAGEGSCLGRIVGEILQFLRIGLVIEQRMASPQAFEKLRNALHHKDHAVVMAILEYAPQLVSSGERTAFLIAALQSADFYHGLTQALQEVEQYHPPVIIETLLGCLLDR